MVPWTLSKNNQSNRWITKKNTCLLQNYQFNRWITNQWLGFCKTIQKMDNMMVTINPCGNVKSFTKNYDIHWYLVHSFTQKPTIGHEYDLVMRLNYLGLWSPIGPSIQSKWALKVGQGFSWECFDRESESVWGRFGLFSTLPPFGKVTIKD